ncbi:hypothetical protein [Marivirga sp.]|uniref:hypothetical protein n=1 Tax=Marivirga sp. TaxID=2018662 RepID=UPI002D80320F|nr:hypothetical protein [Marivirga sp.]HET8860784.1 hypothetical protein [Marivirga sp.]
MFRKTNFILINEISLSFFLKKSGDYFWVLSISGILFWIANFFGLGNTSDSMLYNEIAEEINSKSFFLVEGFKIKPPVFPLIISVIGEQNMVWLNFLCLLGIQSFGVFWSRRITNRFLRHLFLIIVIFSTPHLLISSFLWTEPLFLFTLLLVFYFLDKFQHTTQLKFLIPAIILIVILPFIRFAGVFLIIPLFVVQLATLKNKKIAFFSFLFLLSLIVVWVCIFNEGFIRRWDRFTYLFFSGKLSHLEFNLYSYSKALSSWFFPYVIEGVFSRLLSVMILLAVIYKASRLYFISRANVLFLAPLLFFVYYFLMMSIFKVEYYAAERYLAIFYFLIMLNLFLQIDIYFKSIESVYFRRGVYFTIIIFAVYNLLRTLKNVYFWYDLRSESSWVEIVGNTQSMIL